MPVQPYKYWCSTGTEEPVVVLVPVQVLVLYWLHYWYWCFCGVP
jgi:hypothetical protein